MCKVDKVVMFHDNTIDCIRHPINALCTLTFENFLTSILA